MSLFAIYRDNDVITTYEAETAREAITGFRVDNFGFTSKFVFCGPAAIRSIRNKSVYEAKAISAENRNLSEAW